MEFSLSKQAWTLEGTQQIHVAWMSKYMNKQSSINSFNYLPKKPHTSHPHTSHSYYPPLIIKKLLSKGKSLYVKESSHFWVCTCVPTACMGKGHGKRLGILKIFVVVSEWKHAYMLVEMTYWITKRDLVTERGNNWWNKIPPKSEKQRSG